MTDRLQEIMGMFRGQRGADPNQGARMQQEQHQMGPTPGSPYPPQQQGGRPQQRGGMPEQGAEGAIEQPPEHDVNAIAVDQLNELILTLKIELHHEQDDKRRQQIEQQLHMLREQVQERGGEPIWAHESVDEGVAKLQGHGWIAGDRLNDILQWGSQAVQLPGDHPEPGAGTLRDASGFADWQQNRPTAQHQIGTQLPGDFPEPGVGDPDYAGRVHDTQSNLSRFIGSLGGDGEPVAPTRAGRTGGPEDTMLSPEYQTLPDRSGWGSVVSGVEDYATQRDAAPQIPDAQPEDQLGQALLDAGAVDAMAGRREAPAAPWDDPEFGHVEFSEHIMTPDYFNSVMDDPRLQPMSEEEIRESAAAMVDRIAFGKNQLVQRELDKFNREFPHEFQKAKDRLYEAAAEYKGEAREEFSGRGMFYSSTLASDMGAVDTAVMDNINEISVAAAHRVMELEDELRDIAEWAIVEEEALFREMTAESREEARWLAAFRMDSAIEFDKAVLDRDFKQFTMQHDQKQMELDTYSMQYEQWVQEAQWQAIAMMANDPRIAGALRARGITPDMAAQMDPMELAQQVGTAIDGLKFESELENERAQTAVLWANKRLSDSTATLNLSKSKYYDEQTVQLQTAAEDAGTDEWTAQDWFVFENIMEPVKAMGGLLGQLEHLDGEDREAALQQADIILGTLEAAGSQASHPTLVGIIENLSDQLQDGIGEPTAERLSFIANLTQWVLRKLQGYSRLKSGEAIREGFGEAVTGYQTFMQEERGE